MSDKPARRFWQIHLSTAVVLMFVASGLVWLNIYSHDEKQLGWVLRQVGWPAAYYAEQIVDGVAHPLKIRGFAIHFNIAICAMVLTLIGNLLEFLIRRREARKP